MEFTTHIENLQIPHVYRDGLSVKVSTWGGYGTLVGEDGQPQQVKDLTGTLTLWYVTEEDAIGAERILAKWSDEDVRVIVNSDAGMEQIEIINPINGHIVGTRI